MKKVLAILIICICIISGCTFDEEVKEPRLIEWLPEYKNAEHYKGKGFQDYARYCKYYYDKDVIKFIDKEQAMLGIVNDNDVDKVVNYFENFKKWIENEDFKDKYDFEKGNVNVGDYFYIENHYNDEEFDYNPVKYPTYSVYWFDKETLTMRYIHNGV